MSLAARRRAAQEEAKLQAKIGTAPSRPAVRGQQQPSATAAANSSLELARISAGVVPSEQVGLQQQRRASFAAKEVAPKVGSGPRPSRSALEQSFRETKEPIRRSSYSASGPAVMAAAAVTASSIPRNVDPEMNDLGFGASGVFRASAAAPPTGHEPQAPQVASAGDFIRASQDQAAAAKGGATAAALPDELSMMVDTAQIRKENMEMRDKVQVAAGRHSIVADAGLAEQLEQYEVVLQPKRADIDRLLKKALSKCLMFDGVAPAQVQRCVDAMEACHLKPREVAMRPGETCDYMFVVHSGRIVLRPEAQSAEAAAAAAAQAITLNKGIDRGGRASMQQPREVPLGPGDVFGETNLMHSADVQTAAVATGTTQLWRLHRLAFKLLMMEHNMRDHEARINFLKNVEIFRRLNLSPGELSYMSEASSVVEFADGATIIREGDTDRVLYILTEGEVAVYVGGKYLKQFAPGDYFGEMSMLTGAPRSATVKAAGPCVCLAINDEMWESGLGQYSEVLTRGMQRRLLQELPAIRAITEGLNKAEEKRLLAAFRARDFAPGELVMREGDPARSLFVLEEGEVAICIGGAPGEMGSKEVARRTVGELLGERAIYEGEVRKATVVAATPCRFSEITRDALLDIVAASKQRTELSSLFDALLAKRRAQAEVEAQLISLEWDVRNGPEPLSHHQPPKPAHGRGWTAMQHQLESKDWRDKLAKFVLSFEMQSLRVLCALGQGAFGRVELVMHTNTSKLYALKTQQIKKLDAILREEQAMAECRCPFVMGFFGSHQSGDTSYLLTEALMGGDLKALMDDKTQLPMHEARFYFACVVAAFGVMHSKDWMHRDVKLENLMIGNNGYAKVIDLGLAKPLTSGHAYTMCGTPVYMSPEIVKGTGYNKAADVWALGVLLHEMISGAPPFWPEGSGGLMALFELIVRQEPKLASGYFTPQSKGLIKGMLAKKPTARLGCLAGGFDDVRSHTFFDGFDWRALETGRMPPPYVPKIAESYQEARRDNVRRQSSHVKRASSGWQAPGQH